MSYLYLLNQKIPHLAFIKRPCRLFLIAKTYPPKKWPIPKTGPQWSAPIGRSWIRWGDLGSWQAMGTPAMPRPKK